MALSQAGIAALAVALPGFLAFFFGIIAENKKPERLIDPPVLLFDSTSDTSTCHYPHDPSIVFGALSVVFLVISAVISVIAFYFPYNGTPVAPSNLWKTTSLLVFTGLSLLIFAIAEALLLWTLIVEVSHRNNNVHSGQIEECPTAKSGIFGGAAFLALDATLFFLIALLLTHNARTDYLNITDSDEKGSYGEMGLKVGVEYSPSGKPISTDVSFNDMRV